MNNSSFTFFLLVVFAFFGASCDKADIQKLSPSVNYERDMIVSVNGVTRQGQITMPLMEQNLIHVYAIGDLDTFIMKSCGGRFKKERAWNVTETVKSGLFGWGSKKIDKKNEVEFTIAASDFADTGVCPLYLYGISNDGKHSEAYINWQTKDYQLKGQLVCNMEKRSFEGVEACGTATGSFGKLIFDEEVSMSPKSGCEMKNFSTTPNTIEFRAHSGVCNYEMKGKKSGKRGMYQVYGDDQIIIRN